MGLIKLLVAIAFTDTPRHRELSAARFVAIFIYFIRESMYSPTTPTQTQIHNIPLTRLTDDGLSDALDTERGALAFCAEEETMRWVGVVTTEFTMDDDGGVDALAGGSEAAGALGEAVAQRTSPLGRRA